MTLLLRDYQRTAEQAIYSSWQKGSKNILVQLHTGSGKTVLFTKILADHEGMSIAIAHRNELVSQISLTLAQRGVKHKIIAQAATVRAIVALHLSETGKCYFDPHARCAVAGVDTLIKRQETWFKKVSLVVQDESHHVLRDNKWGKAAALFPNAKGIYLTATPVRADGRGLGRLADGIMDDLIVGPSMRQLIENGYLCDYIIFNHESDVDLSEVPISAGGDFSPPKLRTAVHKSHITGDVVTHYLRHAEGKLGITFAVDIEAATGIAAEFRGLGVPAEVISSKTPDILRHQIMKRFRRREILQLVNVDLLGEGVDVPAIEVITMARPTQSYGLYAQQFGRALRPLDGKDRAIIIDHVGNVMRHRLPDRERVWSLDNRDKRSRSQSTDIIPLRTCLGKNCFAMYERIHKVCPYCGYYTPPATRSAPEQVDGDLTELSGDALARLRGEIARIDGSPRIPQNATPIIQKAIYNRHLEKQQQQEKLRRAISLWAGFHRDHGQNDSIIYKIFNFTFGVDIATAQTIGRREAHELEEKINQQLIRWGVEI